VATAVAHCGDGCGSLWRRLWLIVATAVAYFCDGYGLL